MWSLCVVLFEAIAGKRPFAGRTADEVLLQVVRGEKADVTALRGDCPADVARFFDRSLALDARQRPRTAADLRAQLSALQRAVT